MTLNFKILTAKNVKLLAPKARLYEHGITVEGLKDGDIRYSVDIVCQGQRVHRVIGRKSEGVTRTQAEIFIEQVRTEARFDRLNLPKAGALPKPFSQAGDDYIVRLRASAGKNIDRKERQLALHLNAHFGSTRINKITEFDVKSYRKNRKGGGASDATINRELATLSHLLNSAQSWGWIKRDDIPAIAKTAEGKGRIVSLTDAQCALLLEAAIADQDPDIWLFVLIGLCTGMRHAEITAIRWDEIDYAQCRIFVPKAKGGSRNQPIPAGLSAALKAEHDQALDPDGWVFVPRKAKSKSGHRTYMTSSFRRVVVRANLDRKRVTPHVMRHTAITKLVKGRIDIPTIMKISGHKTTAMVLRYTHIDSEHIDAAAASLTLAIPDRIHREFTTAKGAPKSDAD